MVKPLVLFPLLRRLGGCLAIGTLNREYYLQAGVRPERIFWTPYSIDTDAFLERRFSERGSRRQGGADRPAAGVFPCHGLR